MNDYVILTDSSCDLPDDIVKKYQLEILQLDFIVEGEGSFHNDQADIGKVYSKLRNGANIKTSAANISQASETIIRRKISYIWAFHPDLVLLIRPCIWPVRN